MSNSGIKSSEKTVELIICIANKLADKPHYGATLLGKSLYFIDSMSYLKTGRPITIFEYIKQDFGPTPEPASYLRIRNQMIASKQILKIETPFFGRNQIKYIANREPKSDAFDEDEIVLINDVLDSLCDTNATEISDYTHTFISWIVANHKEKLPFYTFLLTSREPDKKELTWADRSIKEYKKSKRNLNEA